MQKSGVGTSSAPSNSWVNPIHTQGDAYLFGEMFQPIPKPLIPAVIKARVPVWLLVVALATQYAINSTNKQVNPTAE